MYEVKTRRAKQNLLLNCSEVEIKKSHLYANGHIIFCDFDIIYQTDTLTESKKKLTIHYSNFEQETLYYTDYVIDYDFNFIQLVLDNNYIMRRYLKGVDYITF